MSSILTFSLMVQINWPIFIRLFYFCIGLFFSFLYAKPPINIEYIYEITIYSALVLLIVAHIVTSYVSNLHFAKNYLTKA